VSARGVSDGLAREAGAHRAQLVPRGSIGRVMTSRVVIAVTPMTDALSSTRLVKTYNYVKGRVTRHDSGETISLADVLAGTI
jgi:protein subunit release factor A